MKTKSHDRKEGQTGISVSMPVDLLARLDEAAKANYRNRSNMICEILRKVLSDELKRLKPP